MKTIVALLFWAAAVTSLVAAGQEMKISSRAFAVGANIPAQFTCDGANTAPPLKIGDAPANAKSLALIVDDPDAPGGLFTHWLVWNIDPEANAISGGVEGKNDFGKSGYGGPCPPSGSHRYVFKIFALDRQLDLQAGAKRKELDAAMNGHVIGHGEFTAKYARHH